MTLECKFSMFVTADTPDEQAEADRFNQQIKEDGLRNASNAVNIDLTHIKDLSAILIEIGQVVARARASVKQK